MVLHIALVLLLPPRPLFLPLPDILYEWHVCNVMCRLLYLFAFPASMVNQFFGSGFWVSTSVHVWVSITQSTLSFLIISSQASARAPSYILMEVFFPFFYLLTFSCSIFEAAEFFSARTMKNAKCSLPSFSNVSFSFYAADI